MNKIDFLIYKTNDDYFNECLKYISSINIPEGFEVGILSEDEGENVYQGYNKLAKASIADYKVFLADDSFILNEQMINDILSIFKKNNEAVAIGVQGKTASSEKWNVGIVEEYRGDRVETWAGDITPVRYNHYYDRDISKQETFECISVDSLSPVLIFAKGNIVFVEGQITCENIDSDSLKLLVPTVLTPWCYHNCQQMLANPEWDKIYSTMKNVLEHGAYKDIFSALEAEDLWSIKDIRIRQIRTLSQIHYKEEHQHSSIFNIKSLYDIEKYYRALRFEIIALEYGKKFGSWDFLDQCLSTGFITEEFLEDICGRCVQGDKVVYNHYLKKENEDNPLVTVIIPVYKGASFVADTVHSVLNQTYKNLEVIIIDDKSPDDSVQVISEFKDERIVFIASEKNRNVCLSCNLCFKKSHGEYIALIGHDDVWRPDKIERQVRYMEKHKQYGACFTWVNRMFEDNILNTESIDDDWCTIFNCYGHMSAKKLFEHFFFKGNFINAPSALIRKTNLSNTSIGNSTIDVNLLYNPVLLQLQDYELWLRMLLSSNCFIMENKMVNYRIFRGEHQSISKNNPKVLKRTSIEFAWIRYNYIRNMSDSDFVRLLGSEFVRKEANTYKELICERILMLREINNPYLLEYSEPYLMDEEIVDILENEYDFTMKDFYDYTAGKSNDI